MLSAHTWPVRSTSMAELMATMWSFWAMRNGSLTYSVGLNSMSGLLSTKSYSCLVPRQKPAMILPGCRFLRSPLMTPRFDQVDDAVGEHLGVDAQVALGAAGSGSTPLGMAPMPSCRQSPSSIMSAMW